MLLFVNFARGSQHQYQTFHPQFVGNWTTILSATNH